MGVELRNGEAMGFQELDDVDFTDSDLVYHVRDALTSVSMVITQNLFPFKISSLFFFLVETKLN